jgi:AAA family ATP:ADP antiporter
VNKAATELSILPIPHHIKNQAKSFIDIVVDSIATGIAGFILILLVRQFNLATTYITILTILLLFIWILLIYKLRGAYFNSFRTNLQNTLNTNDFDNTRNFRKETTIKSAIRILNTGSEEDILSLMDRLNDFKLNLLRSSIIKLLDHPSSKVKAAAIEQLYFYGKGTAIEKVKDLIHIKDDEVVFVAMQYLLLHTPLKEERIFKNYLDHDSDYIANAALLSLAKESADNNVMAARFKLDERIASKINKIEHSNSEFREEEIAELLMTIGYSGITKYYEFIESKFESDKKYVVKHAIKAAGLTSDARFIDKLLPYLKDKTYRKTAIKALKSFGPSVIKVILVQLDKDKFKNNEQRFIPKIVESFSSLNAIKLLFRLLRNTDVIIRLQAARSLNNLKRKNDGMRFSRSRLSKIITKEIIYYRNSIITIKTLQEIISESLTNESKSGNDSDLLIARENLIATIDNQMQLSQECIFKLLSLNYEKSDIDVAYYGLISENQDARINALEFLDNLIHVKFKGHLFPLLEYNVLKNEQINYASISRRKLTEKACLMRLMNNRGRRIKIEVLNIIRQLDDTKYLSSIAKFRRHKSNDVKELANNITKQLRLKRRSKVQG